VTRVTFYFGAASRYSYLAASQIDAIARRAGASVDWVPLDVIALLARRGHSPFTPTVVSGQYEPAWRRQDAERWAALYGIAFIEPMGRLALDMNLLARACAVAREVNQAEPYARALMQRIFASSDLDVDQAGCVEVARRCGLDRAEFAARLDDESSARRVDDIVGEAQAQGVFGVPSFVVDGDVYWGNDRLPLLAHRLMSAT